MKLASLCLGIATVLSALATSIHAQDASVSGKGKPGYCADSTKCAASYSCVSVQTTRAGVTDVKQCLPSSTAITPVCTGVAPGLCPSFSTTWGTAFREISSVCAYIAPDASGGKCITDTAKANATKGGLECLFVQDPKNKTAQIGVIYGCVDFDGKRLLFEQDSASDRLASKFNYSSVIADSCVNPKNPSGSSFVCSSQGTCAPKSAGSMDYACACNVGFSGTYCEKIVNNKCYNDGVCGGGSCDLTTNECTNCTAGTLGDKCAQCDPTFDSSKVCSGHGKCVASSGTSTLGAADGSMASNASSNTTRMLAAASQYQCECDVGYSDVHCGVMVSSSTGTKKTTTTAPTTGSSAASIVYSVVGVALATVVVTLAH